MKVSSKYIPGHKYRVSPFKQLANHKMLTSVTSVDVTIMVDFIRHVCTNFHMEITVWSNHLVVPHSCSLSYTVLWFMKLGKSMNKYYMMVVNYLHHCGL